MRAKLQVYASGGAAFFFLQRHVRKCTQTHRQLGTHQMHTTASSMRAHTFSHIRTHPHTFAHIHTLSHTSPTQEYWAYTLGEPSPLIHPLAEPLFYHNAPSATHHQQPTSQLPQPQPPTDGGAIAAASVGSVTSGREAVGLEFVSQGANQGLGQPIGAGVVVPPPPPELLQGVWHARSYGLRVQVWLTNGAGCCCFLVGHESSPSRYETRIQCTLCCRLAASDLHPEHTHVYARRHTYTHKCAVAHTAHEDAAPHPFLPHACTYALHIHADVAPTLTRLPRPSCLTHAQTYIHTHYRIHMCVHTHLPAAHSLTHLTHSLACSSR